MVGNCLERWGICALVVVALTGGCALSWADEPPKPWDPAAGTAEIKGVVTLNGEAPKQKKVDMGSDPACQGMHAEPQLSETVVVGAGGALKNVVVTVTRGLERWTFTPPTTPAVLDQKGCVYLPHVLLVQVGQPIRVRNSDAMAHNVHGMPKQNTEFNFGQAKQGDENDVPLTTPEMAVKVKCDIHGWMNAYIAVVSHPFAAVTGEDGSFSLKGLPPGEYTVETWHEKLGKQTQTVTVGDKETKEIPFAYEGKK